MWLVDSSEQPPVARERSVRIREGYGRQVIITEGVSSGDQVVVRGNEGLRDGVPLKITAGEQ